MDDDTRESTDMTPDQMRRDQLLRAADAVEADAAPRIRTSEHGDVTRIDIAPEAAVRPGPGPGAAETDEPATGGAR